jgi:MerR family mercuric resistance operon transcriptional regulator
MLSKLTGCNIETNRYNECVSRPPRTEGDHGVYGEAHTERLTFIRRSREFRFTIQEVRDLLSLVEKKRLTCDEAHAPVIDHLVDTKQKMADL